MTQQKLCKIIPHVYVDTQSEGPSKKRAKPEPALKKATIASMIKRKTPAAASASSTSAAIDSGASTGMEFC